ncbi:rna-directed dna polymerase from mobile element jockey-like [Willisornis vidua]|uniref:Rna-directed dna polymerase from mobile element jockey-like n=1 Tax=Willisornis vidua TaxID=1566151 RepID=A0ABQ9CK04_9PASS|nr:rna-directed dna polymerase from mobile element jockey-like [Willisornis vidua]
MVWRGVKCTLTKLAKDTKLRGAVDSLKGREALQRDLDKLANWAITNCMMFNKSKCQILHLGQGSPGYTYKLENEKLQSCPVQSDLRVLVNSKLNPGEEEAEGRGDLIAVYNFEMGSEGGSADLFFLVTWEKQKGNGMKLHQREVQVGHQEKILH